jgi:hypothetical protein
MACKSAPFNTPRPWGSRKKEEEGFKNTVGRWQWRHTVSQGHLKGLPMSFYLNDTLLILRRIFFSKSEILCQYILVFLFDFMRLINLKDNI